MERLVAWYRVGSSTGAVVALIVANVIPLLGVLFLGWNVWTILTIYWLENGVVGIFNVLKMSKAGGDGPASAAGLTATINGRPTPGPKRPLLIPFFIIHYGMFWVVHGIFILTLPLFQAFGASGGGVFPGGDVSATSHRRRRRDRSDPGAILIVLIGLFISHGVSYRLNFIGRGEYLRTTVARQMVAPYGRLVVLHITIIFGALPISMTGAPASAIVVLVLLKIALDLGLHLAEHRDAPPAGVPDPAGRAGAS